MENDMDVKQKLEMGLGPFWGLQYYFHMIWYNIQGYYLQWDMLYYINVWFSKGIQMV